MKIIICISISIYDNNKFPIEYFECFWNLIIVCTKWLAAHFIVNCLVPKSRWHRKTKATVTPVADIEVVGSGWCEHCRGHRPDGLHGRVLAARAEGYRLSGARGLVEHPAARHLLYRTASLFSSTTHSRTEPKLHYISGRLFMLYTTITTTSTTNV